MPYRSHPFNFLANAFLYPEDISFFKNGLKVLEELAELLKVGSPVASIPPLRELQEEYMRLFVNSPEGVVAPPYASFYRHGQRLLFQEGYDEAIAFYQEAGLQPVDRAEPADHISHELAFVGILLDAGELGILERFLDKHLLKWYPQFQNRLSKVSSARWYPWLGKITGNLLQKLDKEVFYEKKGFS